MGKFDDEVKDKFSHLKEGEVILVENIRYFKEETEDDDNFSKKLGSLGDIYINDAFSCSHRKQASVHKITEYISISYAGPLLKREIDAINLVIKKLCKKSKCKFKVKYLENGDSFLTKPNKTIFSAKKIIKRLTKINPKFSTTGGTSDARFISELCPVIEFGIVGSTMHQVNESISVNDIESLSAIYFEFMKNMCMFCNFCWSSSGISAPLWLVT